MPKQLFQLGQVLSTPGALQALTENHVETISLLHRHALGDWGILEAEDKALNDQAVIEGDRILSSYQLPDGQKVWIITEWDRSATTFLLPSEY